MVVFVRYFLYVLRVRVVHYVCVPQRAGRHLRVIRLCAGVEELQVHAFRFNRLFRRRNACFFTPFRFVHFVTRFFCFLLLSATARFVLGYFGLLLRRVFALLLICVFANARLGEHFGFDGLSLPIRCLRRAVDALSR